MFKEEAAPWARYLGAIYKFDEFSLKQPDRARRNCVSMADYLLALVARFQDDHPDAKGRRQRPAGSVPGSVELRRERALCISDWQAGYPDCGAKVDHEGHSMDRS